MLSDEHVITLQPRTDVMGPGYLRQDFVVADRWNPRMPATLVSSADTDPDRVAMLWVHGFNDYFFHHHVVRRLRKENIDVYGLDLRRYGRSLRPGQLACFVTAMEDYYNEIDQAVRHLREVVGHTCVMLLGHSTGGLLAAIYAHDRRGLDMVNGVVLNSPWLDQNGPAWFIAAAKRAVKPASHLTPLLPLPVGGPGVYGESLHASLHGEWDYSLDWKPLRHEPVRLGWVGAIVRAQKRVHDGLRIDVPVLLAHSDRHRVLTKYIPEAIAADLVLDVAGMRRHAHNLGHFVTECEIPGGCHDLSLSQAGVREEFFTRIGDWAERSCLLTRN